MQNAGMSVGWAERSVRLTAVVVVLAMLGVACRSGSAATGETTDVEAFLGTWMDEDGEAAETDSSFVVEPYRGDEHCSSETTVFLRMGWPPGTELNRLIGDNEARVFVRDVEGHLATATATTFERSVRLPEDATFSGYRNEEAELWFGPERGEEAAYLVIEDRVERWPRFEGACG